MCRKGTTTRSAGAYLLQPLLFALVWRGCEAVPTEVPMLAHRPVDSTVRHATLWQLGQQRHPHTRTHLAGQAACSRQRGRGKQCNLSCRV